jgi:hypothetical protein
MASLLDQPGAGPARFRGDDAGPAPKSAGLRAGVGTCRDAVVVFELLPRNAGSKILKPLLRNNNQCRANSSAD